MENKFNVTNPDNWIPENVGKIYVGRDSGCRCGCHGKYHTEPKKLKSLITRAKNLWLSNESEMTDSNYQYVNISYGNDRAICIYFK